MQISAQSDSKWGKHFRLIAIRSSHFLFPVPSSRLMCNREFATKNASCWLSVCDDRVGIEKQTLKSSLMQWQIKRKQKRLTNTFVSWPGFLLSLWTDGNLNEKINTHGNNDNYLEPLLDNRIYSRNIVLNY